MANISISPCILVFVVISLFLTLYSVDATIPVPGNFNYRDALDKSLLFFEAQRSGKLPSNQRVKWRGDAALRDGFLEGVDLVGGYFDAGDHVKFGLPMAFSMTMLAWAAIDFRKQITDLDQMGHTLWAIKWGTDYFIKAHTQPNVLWAQIGDGNSDHYCWERAEDMTTPRNGYKLDSNHPGSDLAGETAAAMAAAAMAFKPYNSSYANLLLLHAKQIFSFADRFRGLYDNSIPNAKGFYTSSGYSDELLWAAAWLYRATNDEYYLKYVVDNAVYMGGIGCAVKEFSWDNKYAGVQILLSKVLMEGHGGAYTSTLKQYQAKADYFACACLQKNAGYNVQRTPGGLMYVHDWNNMQYVSSAAFLLALYSDYLSATNAILQCPDGHIQPREILIFAKSQADYLLGKNPKSMSYLVGFGQRFPLHVHHRGASIAPMSILHSPVGCVQGFEAWYHRVQGNPNIIYGALVGGPDKNDGYTDDRSNYEQAEPTLSGCAPLIGLFSKLQSVNGYSGSGSHPVQKAIHPEILSTDYGKETLAPETETDPFQAVSPVEFLHSVTHTWTVGTRSYYRHKVIIRNTSNKNLTELKLEMENLSGSIWGLSPTEVKNTYKLPQSLKVLKPGDECIFVYIQGGPQAKVSVSSYH